jgi:hypothetical protein
VCSLVLQCIEPGNAATFTGPDWSVDHSENMRYSYNNADAAVLPAGTKTANSNKNLGNFNANDDGDYYCSFSGIADCAACTTWAASSSINWIIFDLGSAVDVRTIYWGEYEDASSTYHTGAALAVYVGSHATEYAGSGMN